MELKDLQETSQLFYKMQEDDFLFASLNQLPLENIRSIATVYQPSERIQPVNLLRYLIGELLLKKKRVDANIVEELKQAIENRDVSETLILSNELQRQLLAYKKSTRGMFPQWTKYFRVIYPFFWSVQDNKLAEDCLKKLCQEIIDRNNIKSARIHAVGFSGPQNYGEKDVWAAIIPETVGNVQLAYQLFFKITANGIQAAVMKGHKLKHEELDEPQEYFDTWEKASKKLASLIPEWEELNSKLAGEFDRDETLFKQRLAELGVDDVLTFFKIFDNANTAWDLQNNENLTFSIASDQMSFYIGKRYCVVLKKDLFSFIAPEEYKVEGKSYLTFKGDSGATYQEGFNRIELLNHSNIILESIGKEVERDKQPRSIGKFDNLSFRKAAFDLLYRKELISFDSSQGPTTNSNKDLMKSSLNTILYGPPGTGKTHATAELSLQIIDPDFIQKSRDRKEIKNRYKALVEDGRIVFTTFHQTMSYEDFIEGIKPKLEENKEGKIQYEITSGVFKTLCENARKLRFVDADIDWETPTYYKMSLGGLEKPEYHDWCIENGVIGLGWGSKFDITPFKEITDWNEYKDEFEKRYQIEDKLKSYTLQSTFAFLQMKEGDIIVSTRGNRIVDAIGIVTGPYTFRDYSDVDYKHFRDVKWLATNLNTSPDRFFHKQISQMTLYRFKEQDIKKEAFRELTAKWTDGNKPYVLIIDEINRGNVSQIFGELITLIEADKRLGEREELQVTLPYSKQQFGVPNNIYLIGTMNTADRSVEALDTALRRRFNFIEMQPDYLLPALQQVVSGFTLADILQTMNRRIEKLMDKDHLLGHSYLMPVGSSLSELKMVFKNKFIPLLQEYFFGDYSRLGLVIGEGFFEYPENERQIFARFREVDDSDFQNREIYRLRNMDNMSEREFEDAIRQMMQS